MGYLEGFGVTIVSTLFGARASPPSTRAARRTSAVSEHRCRGRREDPKPERFHGRHVLNRYEDGMEKCIGCELCAGVCPANCIYVRGADNDPDDPDSPGERFGYVYEINYLRCIHCDLCVEACPTEAITETKLFEFSFTNRRTPSTRRTSWSSTTTATAAAALGGLARRRRRAHLGLDARHVAVRRCDVRGRGRLERRARPRDARARAGAART